MLCVTLLGPSLTGPPGRTRITRRFRDGRGRGRPCPRKIHREDVESCLTRTVPGGAGGQRMMSRSTTVRRRMRRIGVILSASALGAATVPAGPAAAAGYKPAKDGSKIVKVTKRSAYEFDITVRSKALAK